MNFIQSLLPAIDHLHTMGYWIAFFAALLETTIGIGLLIPGSTIILLMGAMAAGGSFDLGDLIWFAVIGAVIGDNINYFIGRKYGAGIFSKGFWFIKPEHFKKGEFFFEGHGTKSVFISRFIPSLKEIIPLIAGTLGMKRIPFMVWNILGAIGWSLAWILPGYFFAQSLSLAEMWLTRASFFIFILLVIFIVFYVLEISLVKRGGQFFLLISSVWKSIKKAIVENEEVQKFVERHGRLFKFLKNRLNKDSFKGLPLTILSIAFIYVVFLFGGVVEDIINSDIIISADIRVANLLAFFRNTGMTSFFLWITLLGKWQVVLIFTVAAALIFWLWKKQFYIVPLLTCIIGSEMFTSAGKFIFHRARPGVAIYPENSFSFPSGHATIAVAFYGFLTYALIRSSKKWKRKINIFFVGFILIFLIGFSRLYLGVHYFSDVWGGYLAGAIWLIIAISFSEYFSYKKVKYEEVWKKVKKTPATIGIVLTSIVFYIIFALNYQMPNLVLPQEVGQIKISNEMMIFSSEHLKYTETLLGDPQEPLSFIIIAENDQVLMNLFEKADWVLADEVSFSSSIKLAKAAIRKQPYPEAPMTPDFWNASVHDFGFEKATEENDVSTRHHTRFWKTNYIVENGEHIYVGTASFDNAIKWGITHRISPDIDKEREFLYNDLEKTGNIISAKKEQFVDLKLGSNFLGDAFFTDGKIYILGLN